MRYLTLAEALTIAEAVTEIDASTLARVSLLELLEESPGGIDARALHVLTWAHPDLAGAETLEAALAHADLLGERTNGQVGVGMIGDARSVRLCARVLQGLQSDGQTAGGGAHYAAACLGELVVEGASLGGGGRLAPGRWCHRVVAAGEHERRSRGAGEWRLDTLEALGLDPDLLPPAYAPSGVVRDRY